MDLRFAALRVAMVLVAMPVGSGCTSLAKHPSPGKAEAMRVLSVGKEVPDRLVNVQVFATREEARAAIRRHLETRPTLAPSRPAGDPRRFFGRWLHGSHFSANTVLLTGTLSAPQATWFLGDYFADVPANQRRVYSQYFGSLPSSPVRPPIPVYTPGLLPSADAMSELRFTLDAVRASERYGGSLELIFNSDVNVEYELRKQNIVWDVGTLRLHVFVHPSAGAMNPLAPPTRFNYRPVEIEFSYQGVSAYAVSGTTVTREADSRAGDLAASLRQLADALESSNSNAIASFRHAANNFAHAWLHVQHLGLFDQTQSPPEKVRSIELADQHSFLRTEAPTIHVSWSVRIFNTSPPRPLMFGVFADHQVADAEPFLAAGFAEELDSFEMTRRMHVGTFRADECSMLQPVVTLLVAVHDGPSLNDPALQQSPEPGAIVETGTRAPLIFRVLTLDCALLQNHVNTVAPPVSSAISTSQLIYFARDQGVTLTTGNGTVQGSYTMFLEVILNYL